MTGHLHAVGDQVLKRVGQIIRDNIRVTKTMPLVGVAKNLRLYLAIPVNLRVWSFVVSVFVKQ